MMIPEIAILVQDYKHSNLNTIRGLEAATTSDPWIRGYENYVDVAENGDEGFDEWQVVEPITVSGDTSHSICFKLLGAEVYCHESNCCGLSATNFTRG